MSSFFRYKSSSFENDVLNPRPYCKNSSIVILFLENENHFESDSKLMSNSPRGGGHQFIRYLHIVYFFNAESKKNLFHCVWWLQKSVGFNTLSFEL